MNRILSAILVVCMLFSVVPLGVFAEEGEPNFNEQFTEEVEETVPENNFSEEFIEEQYPDEANHAEELLEERLFAEEILAEALPDEDVFEEELLDADVLAEEPDISEEEFCLAGQGNTENAPCFDVLFTFPVSGLEVSVYSDDGVYEPDPENALLFHLPAGKYCYDAYREDFIDSYSNRFEIIASGEQYTEIPVELAIETVYASVNFLTGEYSYYNEPQIYAAGEKEKFSFNFDEYIDIKTAGTLMREDLKSENAGVIRITVNKNSESLDESLDNVEYEYHIVAGENTFISKFAASEALWSEAMKYTGYPEDCDYISRARMIGVSYSEASYISDGYKYYSISYSPVYTTSFAQETAATEKFNQVFSELGLADTSLSEYEKAKRIHDYICTNVEYDDRVYKSSYPASAHSAYAGICNGTCVCQGYATIFYRLALMAGLDARSLSCSDEGHEFNCVSIDGDFYLVDCTWDDGRVIWGDSTVSDYYFLRGTDWWMANHGNGGLGDLYSYTDTFQGRISQNEFALSPSDYSPPSAPASYTITYYLNGGSLPAGSTNPKTYTKETESFTLCNPVKAGYIFTGWTGTGLSGLTETVTVASGSTGNRTYTANYKENKADYYVEHYLQNIDDDSYPDTPAYTDSMTGRVGEKTRAVKKTIPGFTPSAFEQTEISGENPVTVKIYYTRNSYALTVTAGRGTENAAGGGTYRFGKKVTVSANLKDGYENLAWNRQVSQDAVLGTYVEMPACAVEYVATASPVKYTIRYDLAGGTVPGKTGNPGNYTVETESFNMINPLRAGYAFKGWTGTGLTVMTETVTVPQGSTGNREYTANWELVRYIISYDLRLDGASCDNPSEYSAGTGDINLRDAVCPGYRFLGWYDGSGARVSVIPAETGKDVALYAKWSIITYQVKFASNGGSGSMTALKKTVGSAPFNAANRFTRKGYDFAGWAVSDGTSFLPGTKLEMTGIIPCAVGSTVTLYAQWKPKVYTLSYKLNGGDSSGDNPVEYTVETPTFIFAEPEREGYIFSGWYRDKAFKTKIIQVKAGTTGNLTLYAKWKVDIEYDGYEYNIEFNGGDDEVVGTMKQEAMKVGTSKALYANGFTKKGYHFIGWAAAPEGEVLYRNKQSVKDLNVALKDYTGDVKLASLYAVWEANTYTVTFNGNGGSYIPEGSKKSVTSYKQNLVYDVGFELEPNRFSRKGYMFTGEWSTGKSGGELYSETFTCMESSGGLTDVNKGNITLYAVWRYSAAFNPGTGTGTEFTRNDLIYNRSAEVEPEDFEKEGCYIAGWNKSRSEAAKGTVQYRYDAVKNVGPGATLYAVWKPITYKVRFHSNTDAERTKTQTLTYGKSATLIANEFRNPGKKFLGWSVSPDGVVQYKNKATGKFNFTTEKGGYFDLFAVWG